MQVHVACPTVGARETLADAIGECTATGVDECFRTRTVPVIRVVVAPCDTATHLQFLAVLITCIEGCGFRVALAIVVASPTAATAGKVAVVHIVRITHESITDVTKRFHRSQADTIAVMSSYTQVGVHLETIPCTAFCHEFKDEVLVTIIDTGKLCEVALLFVGLHLVDDIGG